jgi:hypothetical protein
MTRMSPITQGLILSLTIGVLYLLCAILVAIAPNILQSALALVTHGLNLAPLAQNVAPMTLPGVLLGLVALMAYSFLAGAIYAVIHNLLRRA